MAKKLGVLTIHHVNNPGSFLQAYSQANSLQKFFPDIDVEIIDIRMKSQEFKDLKYILLNMPRFNLEPFKKQLIFKDFINNCLPLSEKSLFSENYNKCIDFVREKYDVIVVGSDELWKTISDKFARPFPNIYWLTPEINSKKIAFAASANRCEFKDISLKNRKKAKILLKDFDFIGVRDSHTSRLIKKIGVEDKEIYKIPDPSFSCDFDKDYRDILQKKFEKKGIDVKKPILGWNILVPFNVHKHKVMFDFYKDIKEYYKDKGYQIVSLKGNHQFADVNLSGELTPFEWAQVFGYFDFCINGTFHGTIFSLKNKIPFLSIEYQDYYSRIKGKIHDLLDDLSMLDNYLYLSDEDQDVSNILNNAEQSFEKADIESKLGMMRNKYFEGLKNVGKII